MYGSINRGPQCIVPVRWSSYHVAPLFLDLQTCTAQETVGHSVLCPCDGRATLWPSVSWSRYRLGARNTGACVVRIMLMPETMGHSVLYPCDGRTTLWPTVSWRTNMYGSRNSGAQCIAPMRWSSNPVAPCLLAAIQNRSKKHGDRCFRIMLMASCYYSARFLVSLHDHQPPVVGSVNHHPPRLVGSVNHHPTRLLAL